MHHARNAPAEAEAGAAPRRRAPPNPPSAGWIIAPGDFDETQKAAIKANVRSHAVTHPILDDLRHEEHLAGC